MYEVSYDSMMQSLQDCIDKLNSLAMHLAQFKSEVRSCQLSLEEAELEVIMNGTYGGKNAEERKNSLRHALKNDDLYQARLLILNEAKDQYDKAVIDTNAQERVLSAVVAQSRLFVAHHGTHSAAQTELDGLI